MEQHAAMHAGSTCLPPERMSCSCFSVQLAQHFHRPFGIKLVFRPTCLLPEQLDSSPPGQILTGGEAK